MSRFLRWLNVVKWLLPILTQLRSTQAQRMSRRWRKDAAKALRELARMRKRLEKERHIEEERRATYDRQWEKVVDRIDAQDVLLRNHDLAEEALRGELEVVKGTLLASELSGTKHRQITKADIAAGVRQEVAFQFRKPEEPV